MATTDNISEKWKQIQGYEKYYVSNKGRVYSTVSRKFLKQRPIPHGYLRVNLPSKKRSGKDVYVHRLVAEAFCIHPCGCDVVNHIDNNPKNNDASNLEWVTQLNNVHYGMTQKRSRLNARSVIGYKNGKQYKFDSLRLAEKITGCDHSMISKCCKNPKLQSHGYHWAYSEVM